MFGCWKLMTASLSVRRGTKVSDSELLNNKKSSDKHKAATANIWVTKTQILKNNSGTQLSPATLWRHQNYARSLLPLQQGQQGQLLWPPTVGPPLCVTDWMLATLPLLWAGNSRMLLMRPPSILCIPEESKTSKLLFCLCLKDRREYKWEQYKKPLK